MTSLSLRIYFNRGHSSLTNRPAELYLKEPRILEHESDEEVRNRLDEEEQGAEYIAIALE